MLLTFVSGSFSSADQAASNSAYYDIRLEVVPIWKADTTAHWLYVEQAAASALDKPYRQRVYRVTQLDDTTFASAVFAIGEPLVSPDNGRMKSRWPL